MSTPTFNHSLLSSLPLFQSLSDVEVKILTEFLDHDSKPAHTTVFSPGDVRDRLRIIVSGQIELQTQNNDWEEVGTIYGPRQFLNEGALLQEGNIHTAKATTHADTKFYLLRRESFLKLMAAHPLVAGKIQMAVGQYMFNRVNNGNVYSTLGAAFTTGRKRIEHDLLGDKEVPNEAYYGIQTLRARENFNITGVTLRAFPQLIKGLAQVKRAAAIANERVGILDKNIAKAISKACIEIEQGHWHDQFVVDMIQGGAGTSTNMNANEVIANRALELIDETRGMYDKINPNNHVNLSQSTNDFYPTAVRVAILNSLPTLTDALRELCNAFFDKGREFSDVIKMGRTQLQDAVPMTLGQEFEAFGVTMEEDIARIQDMMPLFLEVNMGGTAIGTGINTHPDYRAQVIKALQEVTCHQVKSSANLIEATHDMGSFVFFSGILKRVAVKLSKICNDLRLLSSGPRCGFNEINLPPMQPGSSIMPGKVNPVIPEVVNQVAYQIIGNDLTITMAAEAGQLQLNVMEPVIVFNAFQSVNILTRAARTLTRSCIVGITANRDVCRRYVENSIGVVTALNPYIGYQNSTMIAREALKTGKSVFELVLEHKLLSAAQLEEILKPENMLSSRPITFNTN